MTENEVAKIVVDAACCLRKHFGPALHETVYEVCLLPELKKRCRDKLAQGLLEDRKMGDRKMEFRISVSSSCL
jgi:hypothetical protein